MIKAFLSHSSKNKPFVGEVFSDLGAGLAEYDERTFASGAFNIEAITSAMNRSRLFVLFATRESLESGYVQLETRFALEGLAKKQIRRILTLCLEGVSPKDLPTELQSVSANLRISTPGAAARLIRSELIKIDLGLSQIPRPFVGRLLLKAKITDKLSNPERPTPIAIALSGVDGVGRRTLASKVFQDIYPNIGHVNPVIIVAKGAGRDEIYRELVDVEGTTTKQEYIELIERYESFEADERLTEVCKLIKNIANQNQILYLIDEGGVLSDDGSFTEDMRDIVRSLSKSSRSHPPICFILFRTPPGSTLETDTVEYFRVDRLEHDATRQLVALHIKKRGEISTSEQVDKVAELIDGHPYNLEFLLRLLDMTSLEALLTDPSDMVAFKKRRGDEFIARLALDDTQIQIMAILRVLGPSSIELLFSVSGLATSDFSVALKKLEDYHCVERTTEIVSISRPLRTAFERSARVRLSAETTAQLRTSALEIFRSYSNDDSVSVPLISTAARSAALLNQEDEYLRLFMSPANSVMIARQLYDLRKYSDCIDACRTALDGRRFITDGARIEATRLKSLSLIRLGRSSEASTTINELNRNETNERAVIFFLEGFQHRIDGKPVQATQSYMDSLNLDPRSFSTLRELAHVLLAQGIIVEAKDYAEKALTINPTNPYVIDQVLAIEIAGRDRVDINILFDPRVEELLESLRRYGDEEGRSFYAIRMAEILRRVGRLSEALGELKRAKELNPSHAPAYVMEVEIHIKMGNFATARGTIDTLNVMMDNNSSRSGKSDLPDILYLRVLLLAEEGSLEDAARLLKSVQNRLGRRANSLAKKISIIASGSKVTLTSSLIDFLKSLA